VHQDIFCVDIARYHGNCNLVHAVVMIVAIRNLFASEIQQAHNGVNCFHITLFYFVQPRNKCLM